MDHRVLELNFELGRAAAPTPQTPTDLQALRLRDGVRGHVEAALGEDGLGHVIAAEIAADKVMLRAVVLDFDAAEARLRWTLDASPWGPPSEILRYWDTQAVA